MPLMYVMIYEPIKITPKPPDHAHLLDRSLALAVFTKHLKPKVNASWNDDTLELVPKPLIRSNQKKPPIKIH